MSAREVKIPWRSVPSRGHSPTQKPPNSEQGSESSNTSQRGTNGGEAPGRSSTGVLRGPSHASGRGSRSGGPRCGSVRGGAGVRGDGDGVGLAAGGDCAEDEGGGGGGYVDGGDAGGG